MLVKSGRQALLYLDKNERPDLVLMDIDMPEMDGIEAARKIKEKTRDMVPILFITAIGDKNTSWQQARFEVCMHKWCDMAESDGGIARGMNYI